jgi:type IV fimbrial biogenesis protein FimT
VTLQPTLSLPRRRCSGLTLTELLASLTVTAVALGTAAPSFVTSREHRHLEGVAAQLETDLAYARSEAVAQNRTLRVSFSNDMAGSCYVVHTGTVGACSCGATAPVCAPGAVALHMVRVSADTGVSLSSNVRSMVFDSVKGTVTPTGTVSVQSANGRAIHQVVNLMGRVRSCSPAPALPGYRPC